MAGVTRTGLILALIACPEVAQAAEVGSPDVAGEKRHPLGSVRLGPMVGAGFPNVMSGGVTGKVKDLVGFGANIGSIPQVTVPATHGAKLSQIDVDAYARVYPFRGAFFLGTGLGYEQMKGASSGPVTAYHHTTTAEACAYVNTLYVEPQIGWLWTFGFGLAVGFDVGVQIPVVTSNPIFDATTYGLTVPVQGKGQLADVMRYAAKRPLPVVDVLRVAFLF